MKAVVLFFIVQLSATVATKNKTKSDCEMNEKFEGGKCVTCPICAPGHGLKSQCGFGEGGGLQCEACPEGWYNKEHNQNRCVPCTKCETNYNRITKYKCRSRIDAECGECQPKYFNSYSDAIDDQLYLCTTCKLRPDDPQCKGTKPTHAAVPVTSVTPGRPNDWSKDLPTHEGRSPSHQARSSASAQLDPKEAVDLGHSNTGTGTSASVKKSNNSDTSSAVIKAVVATALSLVTVMLIVVLIWKRKYITKACRKRRRLQTNNNQDEPTVVPPAATAIQMVPLLGAQRPESTDGPNANTRPAYSRSGSQRSGEQNGADVNNMQQAPSPDPVSPDSALGSSREMLPSDKPESHRSSRSSPYTELRADNRQDRRNEYTSLTLETKDETSSQNSSSGSSDHSPNGSVNGGPCTLITNTSSKPSTIVFNGPTTVRIGPHQLGFRQDINNYNPTQENISVTNGGHHVPEQHGLSNGRLPVPEQNGFNNGGQLVSEQNSMTESSHRNLIVPSQPEEHTTEAKLIG